MFDNISDYDDGSWRKKKQDRPVNTQKMMNRISVHSVIVNIILMFLKLAVGLRSKSTAVIADAVHTASDIARTVLILFHGHGENQQSNSFRQEKTELIVGQSLAMSLLFIACCIGWAGVKNIILLAHGGIIPIPGHEAVVVTVISILTKEVMFWYTRSGGQKIRSTALIVAAWHHRGDAFSSVAVLVGVVGANMGVALLDPIVTFVVCLVIVKISIDIYAQAINQLVNKAVDEITVNKIRAIILSVAGVKVINDLQTRIHAGFIYVDVDISVDATLSLIDANKIAEHVQNVLETNNEIKQISVHTNPDAQE